MYMNVFFDRGFHLKLERHQKQKKYRHKNRFLSAAKVNCINRVAWARIHIQVTCSCFKHCSTRLLSSRMAKI